MDKKTKIIAFIISILLLGMIIFLIYLKLGGKSSRGDGAVRVTDCWPQSCQNPVFSPDGKYLMYTKFAKGYNKGPAKLVKINLETKKSQIIVDMEGDNVNVPFGSWIGNKIVFSYENGIAVADDDGTSIEKIASPLVADRNDSQKEQYIEPVFNPTNINEIVFEIVKDEKHQIGLINNGAIIELTDGSYDDRLPSWSPDGKKILWQRSEYKKDSWQITTADIVLDENPYLENIIALTQGPNDTDNSWTWDGKWILSSRTGDGKIPNIFAISTDGKTIKRITQSDHEDGAPSASPDGNWVAFESHKTKNSKFPTDIWIIKSKGLMVMKGLLQAIVDFGKDPG